MPTIKLDFKPLGGYRCLLVTANLREGWRRMKNGYGFCEMLREEYQGDDLLRVQVWVNPSPKRLAPSLTQFSVDLQGDGSTQRLLYSLQNGTLKLGTTMEIVEASRLKNGTLGFFEDQVEIGRAGKIAYLLKLLVSYKTKSPPPPVTREYDTLPFLPGGLPGLGKKR